VYDYRGGIGEGCADLFVRYWKDGHDYGDGSTEN
jgi:hypothetical protein